MAPGSTNEVLLSVYINRKNGLFNQRRRTCNTVESEMVEEKN